MSHTLMSARFRALSVVSSTVLAGALALSGCTSTPKKVAASPTTPKTTAPEAFTATGMPVELAAVIKPLYLGGAVPSSPSAAEVLNKRKPVTAAAGPIVAKGAVAAWKGVPIAVVTSGGDVTLAVKAPTWKVVGGWWPSVGVSAPSVGSPPRRVLMIGSDARPGQNVNNARADSLHIVGLDGKGGGGVLGIARDAYVPLSTGGMGKINSALTAGGPKAQLRTVVSLTGVPLEGYLITGFEGFQQLIDGVGGLPLKAPVAVKDRMSGADVNPGDNKLSGGGALAYGRARHGVAGGDFGRSENQGRLIMAAAGLAKIAGPDKLPGILQNAAPKIGTDMSAEQVLTFAAGVYITDPNRVGNKVAIGGFGMANRQSIVNLDNNARLSFADIRDGNLK